MKYAVSENGKYFYKVGKDGKKARVSKEEYMNKNKSKKGGDGNVSWAIIIGSSGNLSPSVQQHLKENNITEQFVYSGSAFDLKKVEGIQKLIEEIQKQISQHEMKKGAVIFVSAERDPMMFEKCKSTETFKDAFPKIIENKNGEEINKLLTEKQMELWNLNVNAPISVFNSIVNFKDIVFVYISSIYVFTGKVSTTSRKEVIRDPTLDFIDVNITTSAPSISELFKEKGKNLYAYAKRYVELKLNENLFTTNTYTSTHLSDKLKAKVTQFRDMNNYIRTLQEVKDNCAKVVILRMDGITPEKPTEYSDGTFLQALSNPSGALNFVENRYPVFPNQISRVIIGAINKQTDPLKVYHVAGTEKNKGLTKAEMIYEILQLPKINVVTTDRKMDDQNSIAVSNDYIDGKEGDFIRKLAEIYKTLKTEKDRKTGFIQLNKGGSRKKR